MTTSKRRSATKSILTSFVNYTSPISVLVSDDVAVLTLPIAAKYPTQNTMFSTGGRRGPKLQEYDDLRRAAKNAGAVVFKQWGAIDTPVRCELTLYQKGEVFPDAGNLGKAEYDGLQDSGIITNDKLARPSTLDVRPGSDGPRRVVIVLWRPIGYNGARETKSKTLKRAARGNSGLRDSGGAAPPRAARRTKAAPSSKTAEDRAGGAAGRGDAYSVEAFGKAEIIRRIGR